MRRQDTCCSWMETRCWGRRLTQSASNARAVPRRRTRRPQLRQHERGLGLSYGNHRVYRHPLPERSLSMDGPRGGHPLGSTGKPEGDYTDFRLSPDETRLAALLVDPGPVPDAVLRLVRGMDSRLHPLGVVLDAPSLREHRANARLNVSRATGFVHQRRTSNLNRLLGRHVDITPLCSRAASESHQLWH
jgi:hypothetical protein